MMLDIIKGLLGLVSQYKFRPDDLPADFNFSNGNGYYYILDSSNYKYYKREFNLELHIVCCDKNKIQAMQDVEAIDKLVNKKFPTKTSQVIKKGVDLNYIREENGNHHYILEYYIVVNG